MLIHEVYYKTTKTKYDSTHTVDTWNLTQSMIIYILLINAIDIVYNVLILMHGF